MSLSVRESVSEVYSSLKLTFLMINLKRTIHREREEKRQDIGREKKKNNTYGERRKRTRHMEREEKGQNIGKEKKKGKTKGERRKSTSHEEREQK